MLRISKLTDYAIVLTSRLGALVGPQSVRELADDTAIPSPTVSKVLKALTRAQVVTAYRGARGGYALARPAREISVASVISALEGPIAVTECTDESTDASCSHETHCGVRANWQRINAAVQDALEGISVADMTEGPLVSLSRSRADASRQRAEI